MRRNRSRVAESPVATRTVAFWGAAALDFPSCDIVSTSFTVVSVGSSLVPSGQRVKADAACRALVAHDLSLTLQITLT